MEYFKILQFEKEPFSNSPDPEFFFQSMGHVECLQRLELSVRMRRGLNVVLGEVGIGKTTLCRQLIRRFAGEDRMECHLLLDPDFSSSSEFLATVFEMVTGEAPEKGSSQWQVKEGIKQYLFHRGVEEGRTVILIIDEGQKIPDQCLEILREFLNYETNEYKLLQIVVFAQKEFAAVLEARQNLLDRVSLHLSLAPMRFRETRAMIRFRLEHARGGKKAGPSPFGFPAYWAIYRVTRGYPRKIINLCHLILLTLIIQNRSRAGWSMTYACARRAFPERAANWKGVRMGVLAASAAALVVLVGLSTGEFTSRRGKETAAPPKVSDRRERRSRPSQNPKPAIPMGASTAVAAKSPRGGSLKRDSVTPSPPVQAAAPAYKEEGQQKAPLFFGELRVGSRDTLGRMIQFVYGAFNPQYLRSVLKANPQIKTADIISVGDVIRFPVMPVQLEQKPSEAWWVQVVQEKRLQDAHQFLTLFSKVASPMRMIPCWDSRQGLRFLVLLGKGFPNKDAAMARLKGLPTLLASDAKVLNETDRIRSLFPNSAVKTAASHGGAKKRR